MKNPLLKTAKDAHPANADNVVQHLYKGYHPEAIAGTEGISWAEPEQPLHDLVKQANGFDTPAGRDKEHYTGFYPEAVGGGWNPLKDNDNLSGELSNQLGGYAAGTRGADKTQEFINDLYRGTQEPPRKSEGKKPQTVKSVSGSVKIGQRRSKCADVTEAVEAARSVMVRPVKPSKKSDIKTPKFDKWDTLQIHGMRVKGSQKMAWDKARSDGMIQFLSNRYSFSKDASSDIRTALKNVMVSVNSSLNRCHVPKNASAHEAAIKEQARLIATNRKLDKVSSLAKKAAQATHVIYDAGPVGYTVRVMKGNNTIDEYNGGNFRYDSLSQFNRTDKDAIEYSKLLEFAESTAKEMAVEFGLTEDKVYHDEDLLAQEREEAGMDFTLDDNQELRSMGVDPYTEEDEDVDEKRFDNDFLKGMGIKGSIKPKCPHCGSSKYDLMPTDFETAKCKECGKNWDHGIVKGINDPSDSKKAAITSDIPSFEEFMSAYGDDILNLSENYEYYAEDAEEDIDGFSEMDQDEQWKAVREKALVKVEERYEELIYTLGSLDFPATVYRIVSLTGGIESLRLDNVGESWSWDEHAATHFLAGTVGKFILKASVPRTSVDWHETLKLNLDTSLGDVEKEIRVKYDAPIQLLAYRDKKHSEWTPLNKMVTAKAKTAYMTDKEEAEYTRLQMQRLKDEHELNTRLDDHLEVKTCAGCGEDFYANRNDGDYCCYEHSDGYWHGAPDKAGAERTATLKTASPVKIVASTYFDALGRMGSK